MDMRFKYAQHVEKETRFADLANEMMELVETNMSWKENPRELLKKVAEKIKCAESDSMLTFGETELKFALFLDDMVKKAAVAPTFKNPATAKILNRTTEDAIPVKIEILRDIATIAKLIIHANEKSTDGINAFLKKTDDEIKTDIDIFSYIATKELENARIDFMRKALK